MLTHCIGYQRILDVDLPLGLILSDVVKYIGAVTDSDGYGISWTIAIAASAAFMTPVSSPVNTLVLGPGNYKFMDFVHIGVPFTLLVMVVSVIAIPWFFPF